MTVPEPPDPVDDSEILSAPTELGIGSPIVDDSSVIGGPAHER